jgi:hypothetical protein
MMKRALFCDILNFSGKIRGKDLRNILLFLDISPDRLSAELAGDIIFQQIYSKIYVLCKNKSYLLKL